MHRMGILRLGRAALLTGLVAGGLAAVASASLSGPAYSQVSAGVSVRADFRTALEPYGAWRHHRRFGEVWAPAHLSADWQPYTAGHWIYTDDYGWYWVVDDREADWGWITCHYGRWYHDAEYGWVWIPRDVWGPAWVDWRYSTQYIGWAPEPPDEVFVDVQDEPEYWSFVATENITAPYIAAVLLPFQRRAEFFERTVLVNRPVVLSRQGHQFAVNPGVPPSNIAAIRGQPLPTYNVRPHVLAGTAGVPGATQVRAADLRRQRELGTRAGGRERVATRDIVRPSSNVFRPSAAQLQPLSRGEGGRLGQTSPRAARGAAVVQGPAVQGPAQRLQETTSAQQKRGEQRQIAAPQAGRGGEQRRGNIVTPNAPPRTTAQAPAGPRSGNVERRAGGRERIQQSTPIVRRPSERTPIARAPSTNQGLVQRGPTVRPQPTRPPATRPPAIATRPQVNRPPSVAAPANRPAIAPRPQINRPPALMARPPMSQSPSFAARPPSRPMAPPAAAAPRAAPPPAAVARPVAPMAAPRPAAPVTTGAAPRGGPGQIKRQ